MSDNLEKDGGKRGGFIKWLDNFWYHYKWHSLISLFLVITVTVCALQMCHRESYDAYILYAGGHSFNRTSENGDFSEYSKAKVTLEGFVGDYDDDGEVNIAFRNLFLPSEDEMKELGETELSLAFSDRQDMSTIMASSDYYVCFISADVFEDYNKSGLFRDLSYLTPTSDTYEFYNEEKTAIRFSELEFSNLAGMTKLPSDTLICMRKIPTLTHLNRDEVEEVYEESEEIIRAILAYGID